MTNPTPGAPVPPDDLKAEWLRIPAPGPVFCMDAPLNASAAWGYAQAIPERAELADIIDGLMNIVESRWEYDWRGDATNASPADLAIATRAIAAAERLRGGES